MSASSVNKASFSLPHHNVKESNNIRRAQEIIQLVYNRNQINYRVFQKTDTQFYFWDNFGNSAPILTILSLLQAEIYGA